VNNSDWLDIEVLEDYLDGKLDAKTMHRVERLTLEDPFVAEALAGLSLSPKRVQSLSLLQKQLQERVAQKPVEQKRWQITSQRLSIAAAAAVLFVTVSLLFWMREKGNRDQLAASAPKKVEVAIAPITKTKKEVDKVIVESKASKYASRPPAKPSVATLIETPNGAAAFVQPADEVEALEKKEMFAKPAASVQIRGIGSMPSALAGKVAGLRIENDKSAVKGLVYGEDKLPIVGAAVKFKGTSIGGITNEKGEFSLKLDSLIKNPKLNVAYLGYQQKEVNVKAGETVGVELKADHNALNEVVIVGAGPTQKKASITGAVATVFIRPEPVGGWEKFQAYLINNNRLLVEKKPNGKHITVSFDLKENGKPINISASPTLKSEQPLSDAEQQEVIRLFKKGPKWTLPNNTPSGSTTVNIII